MTTAYKFLIVIFTAFLLSTQCFAQEMIDKTQARLVYEFGDTGNVSNRVARLDYLTGELQNNPNAKGFIIEYRFRTEPAGKTIRRLSFYKFYLLSLRGIDAEKIVTIDGGESDCAKTELWIVPPGTTPTIRTDAYKTVFDDIKSAKKYDDFLPPGDYCENNYRFCNFASLETFAALIKREKGVTAYVTLYPDLSFRTFSEMSQIVRDILIKEHKLPLSKLKIVNGGFRKIPAVELWILPKGEHAPVATPNAFPKTRKKRK